MIPNRSIYHRFRNDLSLKMYVSLSKELRDYVGGKTVSTAGSTGSITDRKGSPIFGGSAKHFDSHDIGARYVTVGGNTDYQFGASLTVIAWGMVESLGTYEHIISKYYTAGAVGWNVLRSSNNQWRFQVYNAGTSDTWGGPIIYPYVWYMVAMTIDGATLRGYVNGDLVARTASTKNPDTTNDLLKIGNRRQTVAEGYIGSIHECALFNRPLSPEELKSYYAWAVDTPRKKIFMYDPPAAGGTPIAAFNASYSRRRVA